MTDQKTESKKTRVKERIFLAVDRGDGELKLLEELPSRADFEKRIGDDKWIAEHHDAQNAILRAVKFYDEPGVFIECEVKVTVNRRTASTVDGMMDRKGRHERREDSLKAPKTTGVKVVEPDEEEDAGEPEDLPEADDEPEESEEEEEDEEDAQVKANVNLGDNPWPDEE